MDKAQEVTGPVRNKGTSNHRKRPISPTSETLTEAPQPKKVNQGCNDNDTTDDDEIASLKAILQSNENPDEAVRKYL